MTNQEIDVELTAQVKTERKITRRILELINMGERQRLPEERGFKSTYDWLIRGHGYSSSAAHRRIQAARLLRDIPHIASKVESGELNLTVLSQTQRVVREQEKASGSRVSLEEKQHVLQNIENKTLEDAEKALYEFFPLAEKNGETVIQKRQGGMRITIDLDEEAIEALKRVCELLSHSMPGASYADVIKKLAMEFKTKNAVTATQRAIGCTYQDPVTGRTCGSRHQIERDHIIPVAQGGTDDPSNFRVLCRRHNQFAAEQQLGREFMDRKRLTVTAHQRMKRFQREFWAGVSSSKSWDPPTSC